MLADVGCVRAGHRCVVVVVEIQLTWVVLARTRCSGSPDSLHDDLLKHVDIKPLITLTHVVTPAPVGSQCCNNSNTVPTGYSEPHPLATSQFAAALQMTTHTSPKFTRQFPK